MTSEPKTLAGCTALVTGGSRGIGAAICRQLAAQGAHVLINYSAAAASAEALAAEITGAGGRAQALGFDVADPAATEAALKEPFAQAGKLIAVHNAGISIDGLLARYKPEDLRRQLAVNLEGAFHVAKAALRPMMKARWGRIIAVTSVVGQAGSAGQTMYAATKGGLIAFTKSLALEVASRDITVNAIAPGYIETSMTASFSEVQKAALLAKIPLGRVGRPEDVAHAAAFLASPAAGYITGAVLNVNGGLYM